MVIYIIEGEIGAGKTELIKSLAAEFKSRGKSVCCILEPVDEWVQSGALQLFYSDPDRYAYAFQTYVFASRIKAIVAQCQPDADITLIERSPATDTVFWELQKKNDVEQKMYECWSNMWLALLPFDLTSVTAIYIHADISVCMSRLSARGRDGESSVSREYQVALRAAYEKFLLGERTAPYRKVIVIEPAVAKLDWREQSPTKKEAIDAIIEMMLPSHHY